MLIIVCSRCLVPVLMMYSVSSIVSPCQAEKHWFEDSHLVGFEDLIVGSVSTLKVVGP